MVGHQHIGVDITGLVLGRVGGAFEVKIVFVRKERRLPVIAPLNDMLGHINQFVAGLAGMEHQTGGTDARHYMGSESNRTSRWGRDT
jgi:hypothetical protein